MRGVIVAVLAPLGLTGLIPVAGLPAQEPNGVKAAVKDVQGAWRLEKYESRGEQFDADGDVVFVFFDRGLLIYSTRYRSVSRYEVKLDPGTTPRCIDARMVSASRVTRYWWPSGVLPDFFEDHQGETAEGVYELKDDVLRLCFNVHNPATKERPQELSTRAGGPEVYAYTLRREKSKTD
jgi:uncharacterized protein (TIGR03067 family)